MIKITKAARAETECIIRQTIVGAVLKINHISPTADSIVVNRNGIATGHGYAGRSGR